MENYKKVPPFNSGGAPFARAMDEIHKRSDLRVVDFPISKYVFHLTEPTDLPPVLQDGLTEFSVYSLRSLRAPSVGRVTVPAVCLIGTSLPRIYPSQSSQSFQVIAQ